MCMWVQRVLQLLRDTEAGVRAFQRSHRWREAAKVGLFLLRTTRSHRHASCLLLLLHDSLLHGHTHTLTGGVLHPRPQVINPGGIAPQVSQGQPLPPAVREQLSGAVVLPSTFLRDTVPSLQVWGIVQTHPSSRAKRAAIPGGIHERTLVFPHDNVLLKAAEEEQLSAASPGSTSGSASWAKAWLAMWPLSGQWLTPEYSQYYSIFIFSTIYWLANVFM